MKLWKISQTENDGYDTYDAAIVAAPDEQTAREIHPGGSQEDWDDDVTWCREFGAVKVKLIGEAIEGTQAGVILASFNAG